MRRMPGRPAGAGGSLGLDAGSPPPQPPPPRDPGAGSLERRRRWPRRLVLSLAALDVAYLGALGVLAPADLAGAATGQAAYLFSGREPAILIALSVDPPPHPLLLAASLALLDSIFVLGTFAALDAGLASLRRVPWAQQGLSRLHERLEPHRGAIDRWGIPGLVAFSWIPLVGTGGIAATTLGVLGEIPARRLLPWLVAATATIDLFWCLATSGAAARLPNAEEWFLASGLLLAAAIFVVAWLRRRFAAAPRASQEP